MPEIAGSQNNKYVTHNDALRVLDALVQTAVEDKDLTTPPASPTDGNLYIVNADGGSPGATGDWAGHDEDIAQYYDSAWNFFTPFEGLKVWVKDEDAAYIYNGGWLTESSASGTLPTGGTAGQILEKDSGTNFDASWQGQKEAIVIACSDETTEITAGTGKVTFRMPFAMTLTEVRATLTTAPTAGSPAETFTVDINESGTSILSTKLTIDNGEKTSTTAATAAVISDDDLADDAEITIDVDDAGDGAKGLKVTLIGRRA